jgi:2-oxoisovalerate dehydrogenase E1 component
VDPRRLLEATPGRGAGLSPETLRWAYAEAAYVRSLILREVTLTQAGEAKFWIGGAGEEVHGVATALALRDAVEETGKRHVVPHYRSDVLVIPLGDLEGFPDMAREQMRQFLVRGSDRFSGGGRQMVNHYYVPELSVQPNQSPVGMQLGKAAGIAKGLQLRGVDDAVVLSVVGDGTTAEGDMHDAMNAASVWRIPLLILVTDNDIAIGTAPEEGRGIKDFGLYAESFGFQYFSCNGYELEDSYTVTREAVEHVRGEQAPAILHARVPRLLGHSSAGDMSFRYDLPDPLLRLGGRLVSQGLLEEKDVLKRTEDEPTGPFQTNHAPGRIFTFTEQAVEELAREVLEEPEAAPESVFEHVLPPLPDPPSEPAWEGRTNVPMNVALRTAMDRILAEGDAAIWGQDVGRLGGVFSCTRGLAERYPGLVFDSPLNEPLIAGTAVGAALLPGFRALPEIQFGDYSLNAMHWFVHMGNLHWVTGGRLSPNVTVRMPTDPFRGGANYHSMSLEGYYSHIPGLMILMPSTSFDAYGLLRSAADWPGPALFLEPKILYRMNRGPKLPGEPEKISRVRLMQGGDIVPVDDFRVPLGKAALRREGKDLTLVAWGWAVHQAMEAAEALAQEGVEAEVLDLRTLVPYDREAVERSVAKTGRLLVAHLDQVFAGLGRQIQGDLVEGRPGFLTAVVGMKDVPAIPAAVGLEDQVSLQTPWIVEAGRRLMAADPAAAVDLSDYVRKDDPLAWVESTSRYKRG